MALLLLIFAGIVAVPSFVGPFFWNLGKASAEFTTGFFKVLIEFFLIMMLLSAFLNH